MQRRALKFSVRQLTTLILLGLSGYFLLRILLPFFSPILWAITLGAFIYPMQRRLNHKIKSRDLSALAGTLIAAGVIIAPTVILLIQVGHELVALYQKAQASAWVDKVSQWFNDGSYSTWVQQHLGISAESLRQSVIERLKGFGSFIAGFATGIISNTLSILGTTFFVLFTLFFVLRDGEKFLDWILHLLPMRPDQKVELVKRFNDAINATLMGNLFVAGIQGGLAGVMFFILGIPGALLWTLVMIMLALIPLMGTFLIWFPASIWLMLSGHIVKGIILMIWGVGVVGLIDNFLRPVLIRRQTEIHTIAVFYSVLGGLKLFGLIGFVLGPVVVICFTTLIDFIAPVTEEEVMEESGSDANQEINNPPRHLRRVGS
jgi:predicted PurR-regulated permease PerM